MKLYNLLLMVFGLIVILNVSFVSASFDTTVNLVKDNNGTFSKLSGENLVLSYQFNTGEKIVRDIRSSQPSTIDLNTELFCFEGCNLIPKRVIYRTEIEKDSNLISEIDSKNADFKKNSLINIYLTEKTSAKHAELKTPEVPKELILSSTDRFVSWTGEIVIDDNANYSFFLNITGRAKVLMNNKTMFDNMDSNISYNNTFNSFLEKGNYTFSVEYWSNVDSKPNLFYSVYGNEYQLMPDEKLRFVEGYVKEYQPNNRAMRAFSASSYPESYEIDYSTYPTAVMGYYSLNSQRTPVLLIHGLHGSDGIDTGDTSTWGYWNNIPSKLGDYNYDVWELYYIPANASNFMTAGLLKNEINIVLSYYSVSKLDVISHSMGGFVTLGYIEGLGKSSGGASIPYDNNIRKYVIVASPLHGSFSANRVLMDIAPASYGCNWLANLLGITPDDEYAQAYLDLAVGSEFTWLLNKNSLSNQISYLAITGNQGIPCVPDETKESNSGDSGAGNDGLVAVSSASLLDKNIPLVILNDYNHANEKGNDFTGFFTVDVHKEVDIIDDFIRGNSVQVIKSNLDSGDFYIDPQNSSSNVFSRGSVVLKINSNQSAGEVKLKNKVSNIYYGLTKFKDSRHNSETNNWFYFSDNNLSMYYPTQDYNNQKYGLTFPKGNYEIYINGEKNPSEIEIKGAQTTMKEISWSPVNSTIPINKTNFTSSIKTSSCGGMCIRYNYTINLPTDLPEGIRYDPQFSQTSNDVRILDLDNKTLELKTPDVCNDPGNIVPTCSQTNEFKEIVYNGFNLNKGSCTTTSSGTKICWSSGALVSLETKNAICDQLLQNTTKSSWLNISCLINDKLNQSRDWIQYDSNNCGLIQNQSFIEYQTSETCNFCNPQIVNTTMSTWQNQTSCLVGDYYIQNRSKTGYDSNYSTCFTVTNLSSDLWNNGLNKTYWEFRNQTCDFCKPQMANTSWSNWLNISCLQNNFMNQSRFLVQSDFNNCGEIPNKTVYEYRAVESCSVVNPSLVLINPDSGIYNERSVMFNLSSQDKFVKLVYSDNGGRESSLCTNCNKYAQKKTLGDGNHVLFFRGILPSGKNVTNQTELFIDSKDPQISTTKPQSRGYTNGSDFYIKYTEDNCVVLNLTIRSNQSTIVNSNKCSNGRNVEKFISQDISSFDGKEVEYQFTIIDVAGNKDESRPTRIRVDTTSPQVLQFTNWTIGNYAYFNMTINELNFNKVEYYDNSDSRPRWNSMCTSLKNGNCYKKIYFRDGNHNLNIRITDDAGNAVFRNVVFTAV